MRKKSAVFLDRDGTINQEKQYLHRIEEFELIPGVPEALKRLQDAGYLLVVVSNQSGVARGYFSLQDAERLNAHMVQLLAGDGIVFSGLYLCPHHPTAGTGEYCRECDCRKGKPGMLLQAARELGIDLNSSWMIGDKLSDVEAGVAAGCRSLLVRTGFGVRQVIDESSQCTGIFDDLPQAVGYILSR